MILSAANGIKHSAVPLQFRLRCIKQVQCILRDRHDLRVCEGRCAHNAHYCGKGFVLHIQIDAFRCVLIALAGSIRVELCDPHGHLIPFAEEEQKIFRAFAQFSAEGRDLCRFFLESIVLRCPRFVAFKNIRKVPGGLLRDLTAFGKSVLCHTLFLLYREYPIYVSYQITLSFSITGTFSAQEKRNDTKAYLCYNNLLYFLTGRLSRMEKNYA